MGDSRSIDDHHLKDYLQHEIRRAFYFEFPESGIIYDMPSSRIKILSKEIDASRPCDAYGFIDGQAFVFDYNREETGESMRYDSISYERRISLERAVDAGALVFTLCHFVSLRLICFADFGNRAGSRLIPDESNTLEIVARTSVTCYAIRKMFEKIL